MAGYSFNITLPYLSKIEMSSSRGFEHPFNNLLSFLTRHPSIVNLELCSVTRPPAHHQPRKLLPALETLRVDPWFTVWLLDREKAFERLISLGLVPEAYPRFRALSNYNTFDGVLRLRRIPHVTCVYISFYQATGVVE